MDLAGLLENRRWLRREHPFPHVVARDVFREPVYRELAAAFQALIDRGLATAPERDRLARSTRGYDAYVLGFHRDVTAPFQVFLGRAWHDALAGLFGVRATGDVNGGFHHHLPGSASGRCHNDLNPGWFPDVAGDGVHLIDHGVCDYHHGTARTPGLALRETVRAVALLYYLNNPPWSPGDGGETGLYDGPLGPVDAPAAAVPPINNSLLAFECTPWSYHAFLHNRRHPRNSVIMWLHRDKREAVARWGERAIVKWQAVPGKEAAP